MPFGLSVRDDPGMLRCNRGERLTNLERNVVLVFLADVASLDIIGLIFTADIDVVGSLISLASTFVFALYIWWPPVATTLLGVVFAASLILGKDSSVLFVAAIAAGMVMRLGSSALIPS